MATTLLMLTCAVTGLVVGSLVTVVVDRVPRGASIVSPSACSACGHRLTPADLVPVVSWLTSRGRCRHCGHPIGWEPLAIEVATAGMFALFGLRFGAEPVLVAYCILGAALVTLVAIDLREFRLPREITYPSIALGAVALTVAALLDAESERIGTMTVGAVLALAIMGSIYLVSRGQMGDGDVRLSPLLGMYLGYLGVAVVPIGLFLGFVLGALVGVVAMAVGAAGRKTALPFGPFLAAGTVIAIFVGPDIVELMWNR